MNDSKNGVDRVGVRRLANRTAALFRIPFRKEIAALQSPPTILLTNPDVSITFLKRLRHQFDIELYLCIPRLAHVARIPISKQREEISIRSIDSNRHIADFDHDT